MTPDLLSLSLSLSIIGCSRLLPPTMRRALSVSSATGARWHQVLVSKEEGQ